MSAHGERPRCQFKSNNTDWTIRDQQICAISHADRPWREETMKVAIRGNWITRTGKQIAHEDLSAAYFLMTAFALPTRRSEAVLGKKSTMPVICFARLYLFATLATAEVAA